MSTATVIPAGAADPNRRTWIVSPAWDLSYLVLTPALIVPLATIAARRWFTPEQVYLAVIAFASLGHHLPGFMRAYGDRELFARFRWRFLLAPPLCFGLALLFTPPASVARALSLPWVHLHGLELILLVWGTWHGLMQTYGFMRIYDLRRGLNDRTTARLDHALCLAIFAGGMVLSDHRMLGLANAMWEAGLPTFGPQTLAAARWTAAAACGAVIVAYLINLVRLHRTGVPVNGVKLLLAASTGWFYWYCGRISTNVLVGLAMFEIYHAVQYNAIVWVYNRRLVERRGKGSGLLSFLFGDRYTQLGLYLAAIGAYSSIRFFTATPGDRIFSGDLDGAHQWLIAWFVASSMLHFYYDGFIWKVSESTTRANLVEGPESCDSRSPLIPGAVHAAKWSALLAIAAGLVFAERREAISGGPQRELQMAEALSSLAPADWEYRFNLAVALDDAGKPRQAESQFRQAIGLAPDEALPREALGAHLVREKQPQQALEELEASTKISPSAEGCYQTGLAHLMLGDAGSAVGPLKRAIEIEPDFFQAHLQLGDAMIAQGKLEPAVEEFEIATGLRPKVVDARVALADALFKVGRRKDAISALREGLEQQPRSAELNFALGLVLQQTGESEEAQERLRTAAELGLRAPGALP